MNDIFEYRKVWDPYLGEYVEKKVRRKLTDDDRIAILCEYFETGEPASKIVEKYQLSTKAVLFSWIDKYINEDFELAGNIRNQDEKLDANQELRQEIERLRKALALEKKAREMDKLRADAYSTMIDVAEKNFNIPIRKKPGTKQ